MSVTVELQISYFSADSCTSVEYTVEETFPTYAAAVDGADYMIETAYDDAMEDGAMADTFYFEFDYLMPQSVAESNNLEYTMEAV